MKYILPWLLLLLFWGVPAFADDQAQPPAATPNLMQNLFKKPVVPTQPATKTAPAADNTGKSAGDSPVQRQLPLAPGFGNNPAKTKTKEEQTNQTANNGYKVPKGHNDDKDFGDPDLISLEQQDTIVVAMPDIANHVEMSRSDINLIVCPTDITDADEGVATSAEKNVKIKVKGRYALVKFMVRKMPQEDGQDKLAYSSTPTEIYVICGDQMFKIFGHPKPVPGRTVALSLGAGNRIKKNTELFAASSYKKKILSIANAVYKEDIPDSFTVTNEKKVIDIYEAFTVKLRRSIKIDGEGFRVKEYLAYLKPGAGNVEVNERDFLRRAFTERPAYIEVDNHHPKIGDTVRIIIIEHVAAQEMPQ